MCNILWQVEQEEEEQEQDVAATAHSHKLNAKLFEFLHSSRWRPLPLPVPVQLRVWLPFCFVSLWRCFCQMNFAAAAHIKLPAARKNQAAGTGSRGEGERGVAGRADTDLDTVIRICPFRVFGNFSTLLNYRVSCLHSSSAAAASVAAATPVVVADVVDVVVGRQAGTFPVQNTFRFHHGQQQQQKQQQHQLPMGHSSQQAEQEKDGREEEQWLRFVNLLAHCKRLRPRVVAVATTLTCAAQKQ